MRTVPYTPSPAHTHTRPACNPTYYLGCNPLCPGWLQLYNQVLGQIDCREGLLPAVKRARYASLEQAAAPTSVSVRWGAIARSGSQRDART